MSCVDDLAANKTDAKSSWLVGKVGVGVWGDGQWGEMQVESV